jgi:membrane protein DedA with SNARE-associated domain
MKVVWFFCAILAGKFLRFLLWAAITVFYGPAIVHTVTHALHEHLGIVLGTFGTIIVALAIFVTRKIFDRRNGTRLPIEEADKTA